MRAILLRLAIVAVVLFLAVSILGPHLDSLFSKWGDPDVVQENILTYLFVFAAACLALVVVRTLIGIAFVVIAVLVVIYLIQAGILGFLSF